MLIVKILACSDTNAEYLIMTPSCPLTCETLGSPCTYKKNKNPGCYCKSGNVLNCQGNCVPINGYCSKCNEINEYHTDCAPTPEPTCKNPNQKSIGKSSACICKTGYIRDYNSKCILQKDCPTCSDTNAEYSNTVPLCTLNCMTLGDSCTNRTENNPGCTCKAGYVQDCQSSCVSSSHYCQSCPFNEYYSDCGKKPEKSCQSPTQKPVASSPGCVCKPDLVRDFDNNCIDPSKCPGMFKLNFRSIMMIVFWFLISYVQTKFYQTKLPKLHF